MNYQFLEIKGVSTWTPFYSLQTREPYDYMNSNTENRLLSAGIEKLISRGKRILDTKQEAWTKQTLYELQRLNSHFPESAIWEEGDRHTRTDTHSHRQAAPVIV